MITGMLNNSGWHVNHKRPSRQICFANRLPGNGRADLAAGGAESATETTQEGSALVDRPVHPARTAGIHKTRQWRRIYRKEGARLDRRGGSQDGLHRTRFTLGKRLLRELQRTVPRRTFEW